MTRMRNADLATNLVLRPIGGHVTTASGRRIPSPPWILSDDPRTAIDYDRWLLEQGRDEARETGEEWMVARLAGVDGGAMDEATRNLLGDYLFGRAKPEFEARGSATTVAGA